MEKKSRRKSSSAERELERRKRRQEVSFVVFNVFKSKVSKNASITLFLIGTILTSLKNG